MRSELQNFNANTLGYSTEKGLGIFTQAGMKMGLEYKLSDRLSINIGIEGKAFSNYNGRMNNVFSFPISIGFAHKF